MTHGHEILEMLAERPYTIGELFEAMAQKFGPEERYCTCHHENLTPEELIVFFLNRGKVQLSATGVTCHHDGEGEHHCNQDGEEHHCCHHSEGEHHCCHHHDE